MAGSENFRRSRLKTAVDHVLQVDAVFAHAVPYRHPVDAQQSGGLALVAARGPKGVDKLLPLGVGRSINRRFKP